MATKVTNAATIAKPAKIWAAMYENNLLNIDESGDVILFEMNFPKYGIMML